MLQILHDVKIDWLGNRVWFIGISVLLMLRLVSGMSLIGDKSVTFDPEIRRPVSLRPRSGDRSATVSPKGNNSR